MTVYELLKQGCEIKFPYGYIIKGNPETNYIDTYTELFGEKYSDGLRILSKDGTRLALSDAKIHEQLNKT